MKVLPRAPHESLEAAFVKAPKLQSCCFPTKVMYMGVIALPVPQKGFNGKIMIKRVSKEAEQQKGTSFTHTFSDKYEITHKIKNVGWCDCYHGDFGKDIKVDDFLWDIKMEYELEDKVATRLVLSYCRYSRTGKTKKIIRIRQDRRNANEYY
jgi:hypothetical protein